MLYSQLKRMKHEIETKGFGKYRVFQDYSLCPDAIDGGEIFVLENFYVNPDRWSTQRIILRNENGKVVETYLTDRRLFLHPILLGKTCEVVFSQSGFRIMQLSVLADRELYEVFERVYKSKNLDFTLLISNDQDEVYWKNFVSWKKAEKEHRQLEEICKQLLEGPDDFVFDMNMEEVEFDIDFEIAGGDCVITPKEEKDMFDEIPEWFCIYEDESVSDKVSRLGYEEEMYLDRVCDFGGECKEIRLAVGEDRMLTSYNVNSEIPLWISQLYLAPLRMKVQVVPGEDKVRIAHIEMFKSEQLQSIVKEFWPYDEITVHQLVAYMRVEV